MGLEWERVTFGGVRDFQDVALGVIRMQQIGDGLRDEALNALVVLFLNSSLAFDVFLPGFAMLVFLLPRH